MAAQKDSKQEEADKLRDLSIERKGQKLIVPEDVELGTAIKALQLKMTEEEQTVAIDHTINTDVAEGMVAFLRVMEREFGFVANTGRDMGFWGKKPPKYLGIETEPGKKESIPVGDLRIPGISGYLQPGFNIQKNRAVFRITGEVQGKDRFKVDKIIAMVQEECRSNSIYKGHAIETSFPLVEECNSLEDTFPSFAKLHPVKTDQIIFSKDTEDQITVALFIPIKRTQECRDAKIPLKRGVLLEGKYGTGKTLTAAATATLCKENGWTFIYLKDVKRLSQAYAFAQNYQPAVIFSEDIDQVLQDPDQRDEEVNNILNALDGIDSKGLEVITVLTTNHLEKITQAMLRPGRLDTVVSVQPPDRSAAIRLVQMYAGKLLAPNSDLSGAGDLLAGEIPAIIREVVERSKLAALRREGELKLEGSDIEVTAKSMKAHMNLLKTSEPDKRSEREKAAAILAEGQVRAATVSVSRLRDESSSNATPSIQSASVVVG